MSYLSALKLSQFRCYDAAHLNALSSGLVVLYGANGAGKTNVLEAISMLSPGRGLRGAKIQDMQKNDALNAWAVAADVQTDIGIIKIGTGLDPVKDKRVVRINGETAKAQTALSDYLSCIWLTPQMDRLFIDGASERRRFLDRLIFAFDPGHSGRVTRYENAMRQRSKLLQGDEQPDPSWLDGLEAQMAETGIALAAARLDFIGRLQTACDQADDTHFPRAQLKSGGTVEELLGKAPALEVEDMLRYQFKESRTQDACTGGAASGPHKSDLIVHYAAKNMPAAQCSTGEQKALLIGLILAHAQLIAAERGAPPILLLDEVAAHLDEGRRAALYDLLISLGGQVWMTGTDSSLFDAIQNTAQFFQVDSAQIHQKNQGLAA
ncbi:MAG: DNA replication/repair protein RecF [Pseudomonadota bacterium]